MTQKLTRDWQWQKRKYVDASLVPLARLILLLTVALERWAMVCQPWTTDFIVTTIIVCRKHITIVILVVCMYLEQRWLCEGDGQQIKADDNSILLSHGDPTNKWPSSISPVSLEPRVCGEHCVFAIFHHCFWQRHCVIHTEHYVTVVDRQTNEEGTCYCVCV